MRRSIGRLFSAFFSAAVAAALFAQSARTSTPASGYSQFDAAAWSPERFPESRRPRVSNSGNAPPGVLGNNCYVGSASHEPGAQTLDIDEATPNKPITAFGEEPPTFKRQTDRSKVFA
jgi:hypothetical protein